MAAQLLTVLFNFHRLSAQGHMCARDPVHCGHVARFKISPRQKRKSCRFGHSSIQCARSHVTHAMARTRGPAARYLDSGSWSSLLPSPVGSRCLFAALSLIQESSASPVFSPNPNGHPFSNKPFSPSITAPSIALIVKPPRQSQWLLLKKSSRPSFLLLSRNLRLFSSPPRSLPRPLNGTRRYAQLLQINHDLTPS